jgi:hypothetical protein
MMPATRCSSLLVRLPGALVLSLLAAFALPPTARAERLRSAFDPRLHVRPPTMKAIDGGAAELLLDDDFTAAAARYRAQHGAVAQVAQAITLSGEVLLLQGDDQIVTFDGTGYGLQNDALPLAARRVIEDRGDHFQAITVWLTFEDRNSRAAAAYEVPVKNEVQGLGRLLPVKDSSDAYGSHGILRSMLNMKTVGLGAGDTMDSWRLSLETWGQESAHRWLVFLLFRDPRTGRASDAMLGRQCAHYSRYVDTQASVHDGFAWRDNGNGTFTWTEASQRYGDLDLYGMGLMAPDEVPPFFLIDDIPGYRYPTSCGLYSLVARMPDQTVSGSRVDITIDDVIAANGVRRVPTDERQDYWREAEVIILAPNETPASPRVQALAARINRARLFWEQWNLEASRERLVMCTQVTADCGDPRSDIAGLVFNAAQKAPASGPLSLEMKVSNTGERTATGIKASLEVTAPGLESRQDVKDVGSLERGAAKTVPFDLDLRAIECGTELTVKAATQSDFHYHRTRTSFLVGATDRHSDGFEIDSGWTTDPDGDDTQSGARWERGKPQATDLLGASVQPGAAHGGTGAWVTGLAPDVPTAPRASLVREGKATLVSPLYESEGLRDPRLRYWVSFAGVRGDPTGLGLEPSPQSRLLVQARAVDLTATGPVPGPWVDVDALENLITTDWVQRTALLPGEVTGKNQLQLRFVASDANPERGGVEAAIDDLEITSNLPACYLPAMVVKPPRGDGGSGCALAARPARASWPVMVIALCAASWLTFRRRLPRRAPPRPSVPAPGTASGDRCPGARPPSSCCRRTR